MRGCIRTGVALLFLGLCGLAGMTVIGGLLFVAKRLLGIE
jgi:hypothetical protein